MAFPGTYNFNYYRGDTYSFVITPKDASGNTFALDSFTSALFTIADKRGTSATQRYGSDSGITATINTVDDTVTCTISATGGRNLASGTTYVYDVEITSGSIKYTILTGTITPTDDITGAV